MMGVTGTGKSTIGMRLAASLKARFVDADDLHSSEAVAAMSQGIPLTDEDRWPWLEAVATVLDEGENIVVACSALKRVYRDCIRDVTGDTVVFVHLTAPANVITTWVRRRSVTTDHFAGTDLLASQFADLEPLGDDERGGRIAVHNYSREGAAVIARAIVDAATP